MGPTVGVHAFEIESPAALSAPHGAGCALLDSALADGVTGRWSILAAAPVARVWWADGLRSDGLAGAATPGADRADPVEALAAVCDWFGRQVPAQALPGLPFVGGAVGYLSYELGAHLEGVPAHDVDATGVPAFWFAFHPGAVVLDRLAQRAWAVGIDSPFGSARAAARAAAETAERGPWLASPGAAPSRIVALPDRPAHTEAVRRARGYLGAGDIYQVNLTSQIGAETGLHPADVWARLRDEAPAPFAAWLDAGDHAVLSVSPERFLSVRGRTVETRPIKGTRPRGDTPRGDAQLARELRASEKDRAELLMITDLHRNDLGRVCGYGSVRTDPVFGARSFPAVHHLESTVTGRLAPGRTRWDALRAAFPAGSVTGAPKHRAMQIIRELEATRRGAYCGAIGYFDARGDVDLSVAIRTAVYADGRISYGAGGGIVWDSQPEVEYDELLVKARPFLRQLGIADAA